MVIQKSLRLFNSTISLFRKTWNTIDIHECIYSSTQSPNISVILYLLKCIEQRKQRPGEFPGSHFRKDKATRHHV